MDCPRKIQLPPELLSELANAIRYDDRWIGLRVSFSFDYFLVKNLAKIRQKKPKQGIIRSINEAIEKLKILLIRLYGEQAVEGRGHLSIVCYAAEAIISMEKAISKKEKARMN
ncbi:hypothetical protein niasHS_014241 [Heterodera schachtii]|uniref:Uncharacterized protein n=1 Tax=Heterodera schachtii TaxID=97005 RepID=A0ABD2I698_HETSC